MTVKTVFVWLIGFAWLLLVSIAWFGLGKNVVFWAVIIALVIVAMIVASMWYNRPIS